MQRTTRSFPNRVSILINLAASQIKQKKFEEGCAETKKKQEDAKKKQEEDRKAEETKRTVVFNGKDFKIIGTDGFFLHTQSYFLLFRSPFFTKVECLPAKLLNFLDELNIT